MEKIQYFMCGSVVKREMLGGWERKKKERKKVVQTFEIWLTSAALSVRQHGKYNNNPAL